MIKNIEVIKQSHKVSILVYHVVICPKHRKNSLNKLVTINLFKKAVTGYPITIIEAEIMPDHVHLCIQTDMSLSGSDVMRIIKSFSSYIIKQVIPEWEGWGRGGYMGTVGKNSIDQVITYIQNQK